jgi:hypothetical protein
LEEYYKNNGKKILEHGQLVAKIKVMHCAEQAYLLYL